MINENFKIIFVEDKYLYKSSKTKRTRLRERERERVLFIFKDITNLQTITEYLSY